MFLYDVKKKYKDVNPVGIVKIQNIVDYVFSYPKVVNTKPTDVFSFKLPFSTSWFEFKVPKFLNLNGEYKKVVDWGGTECGILAEIRILKEDEEGRISEFFREVILNIYIKPNNEAMHLSSISIIVDIKTGKAIPEEIEYFHYASQEMSGIMDSYKKDNNIKALEVGNRTIRMMDTISCGAMSMFFNFYHCKNVHLKSTNINEKLVKARKRKGKVFVEKYYTLFIEPMKKILDNECGAKEKGVPEAFHYALSIMRGHFKEYKKDENGKGGLFGKLEGTWWWNDHVRGDKSGNSGVIYKDYDINLKSLDTKNIKSRI